MPPILGDPDALIAAAESLRNASARLQETRDAIAAHGRSITTDWSGLAAPLALARIEEDASAAQRVADVCARAGPPLRVFAEELRRAQQDYAEGERLASEGRAAVTAAGSGAVPAADADAAREQAMIAANSGTSLMTAAQDRARVANEAAARELDAAASLLAGVAPPAGTVSPAGAPASSSGGAANVMREVGNGVASLGNAALRNPLDIGAILGGGALAAVSAVGAAASVPATASGGGAVAGVPLGVASVGGMVTGAGIAGAGAIDLIGHALGDNRVQPFQVNAEADSRPAAERIATVGEPGRSDNVRQLLTEEEVRELYDELSEGGTPLDRPSYNGEWVTAPDGTQVGLRGTSLSGGATIDAVLPTGEQWKIHRK